MSNVIPDNQVIVKCGQKLVLRSKKWKLLIEKFSFIDLLFGKVAE